MILLLLPILSLVMLPTFALHEMDVRWVRSGAPLYEISSDFNDLKVKLNDEQMWKWTDDSPVNVTFRVEWKSGASISTVQVALPQDRDWWAFFHLCETFVGDPMWKMRILETDGKGWPRLVEFYSDPGGEIGEGKPSVDFTFCLGDATEQVQKPCYEPYFFTMTTIDVTADSRTETITMILAIDNTDPDIEVTLWPRDEDGNPDVDGILVPCGDHYFLMNVTAHDVAEHDEGLVAVEIWLDEDLLYSDEDLDIPPGGMWILPNFEIWNRAEDDHNLTVKVWDGSGNMGTETVVFDYDEPDRPKASVSPESGFVGTKVTVSGEYFTAGATYEIYVNLPDGPLRVINGTVGLDGTFAAPFDFPSEAKWHGKYAIEVYSDPCNLTVENGRHLIFEVLPQVIFDPNDVIGPALINVEATGFIKPDAEDPETGVLYILANNKDALQGVNSQAMDNWYIGDDGTLKNIISIATGRFTECGLFWPFLEPGAYEVTLFLAANGFYWDINDWEPWERDEATATVTVTSTLDLIEKIYEDTQDIRSRVANVEVIVTEIKTDSVEILLKVTDNHGWIQTIKGDVETIRDDYVIVVVDDVGYIRVKVDDVLAKIPEDVASQTTADKILKKADTSGLSINLAMVLSAIAAIAAVAATVVVVRRLRVAA